MSAVAEFRLSITKALGDQLAYVLAGLVPEPLTMPNIGRLSRRGGVYQLYLEDRLIYIGKADTSIPERLADHRRKLSGRLNIRLDDMGFTAAYVDEDLSAVAPETLLIKRHRNTGEAPWNFNGFGNKDPGQERDTSKVDADHFDALYPANLDYACPGIPIGTYLVGDLLRALKENTPFVFRYTGGNRRREHQPSVFWETLVVVTSAPATADELFQLVADALPGWQLTALPGYVIMYPASSKIYPSARKIYIADRTD